MAISPNTPPNIFAQAKALAEIIEGLTMNQTDQGMLALITSAWGAPQRFTQARRDNTYPARVYIQYPGVSIACYEGVQSNNQAIRMGSGYATAGILVPPFQSGHPFIAQLCVNALATELANTLPRQQYLTLAGHSMGGCIAQCLGSGANLAGTWGRVRASSYGSPSWCYGADLAILEQLTAPRWMLEADVIPKIWPRIEEGPVMNAAAGAGYLLARRYQQSAQGIYLQNDGTVQYVNRPPIGGQIAEVDVATLIQNVNNDVFNPHWISSYIDWFQTNGQEMVPGARVRGQVPEVIVEDVPIPDHIPARALQPMLKPALRDRHRDQYGPPIVVPKQVIFRAVKDGQSWGVQCVGTWCMWAMKRRRATHTAFLLNRAFKEMLRAGIVYPDAMLSVLSDVMTLANEGGAGISPRMNFEPLNVVLPPRALR